MRIKPAIYVLPVALMLAVASCSAGSEGETATSSSSESSAAESTAAAEGSAEAESSGSESAEAESSEAAGDVLVGTGYTYVLPAGWGTNAEATELGAGADTVVLDLQATGTFANNVNVVVTPGDITPETYEASASQIESAGGVDVAIAPRQDVAGVEAGQMTATMTQSGLTYDIQQFAASREGTTYIITFSFAVDAADADRAEIVNTVLGSWSWS